MSHWACCKEMHEAGGFHHHSCLKLTGVKKWFSVKRDITKNHNIVVNFSDSHSHYLYPYRYVCKSDTEAAHSPGHPDLSKWISTYKSFYQCASGRQQKMQICITEFAEMHKQQNQEAP
eukprot:gene17869-19650_t